MTDQEKMTLAENFKRLEENIQKYAAGKKRPLVVAATKTVDAQVINYAAENLGLTDIGENRVQELLSKYDALDKDRLRIHFIGHLQKNKVKYIVGKVALIHSLDSVALALEIEKQSAKLGIVSDVLVEVNIGAEENKSGADASEVAEIVRCVSELPHVNLCGMMTVGPKCSSHGEYRSYFDKTYALFSEIFLDKSGINGHNIEDPILSMGMSDSYYAALESGANVIRPGSCLFGSRVYPEKNTEN